MIKCKAPGDILMDDQLRWVLALLNEQGVPYWLNSGTLLGLMREGALLEHDQDIDISLWADHEAELKKVLPYFKKAGYRVLAADYEGQRFQYNLSLSSGAGHRNIDISLFRRCGEYAWCPEYYFKVQPGGSEGGGRRGAVRGLLRFFWRKFIALVPLRVSISSWPWRSFVNVATWWIPAAYFDNLEFAAAPGAFIPADWPGYLKFRYGDWRVPRRDWVFHRDDGGLVAAAPGALLGAEPAGTGPATKK